MKSLSRRKFLGKSALAIAASPAIGSFVSLSAKSARAVAGANEKIRVGVIGMGGIAGPNLNAFLANAEVECPVLCDVDEAQFARGVELVEQRRGYKPETVKDFRRVLDRADIDAVIVNTPDHWHALPTVFACQAGKDVYVEKPLATTIDEGRAMVEAGRRHHRVVQMGTQRRSAQHCIEAMELVRTGKLGKVGLVRAWAHLDWLGGVGNPADTEPPPTVDYNMWLGPAPKRPFNPNRFHFNFRWFWDYAGGLMTDWGVHLMDMLLFGMPIEPVKSVSCVGGKFVLDDNSETPDTQVALYEFETYTLIWEHKVGTGVGINGRPWGMMWTGSEGTLVLNDSGYEIIPEPKKKSLERGEFKGSGDARPAHVRNFLDCIKSREQPVMNAELGHYVSTISHLGNLALRSGNKIVWDAERERVVNDRKADQLVGVRYRGPWRLPYSRRA